MERAVEVLDLPALDGIAEIVPLLPAERAVSFLTGMSPDRTTDVLRQLEEPVRSQLLGRLDSETQESLRRLLAYPTHKRCQPDDDRVRQRAGDLDHRTDP